MCFFCTFTVEWFRKGLSEPEFIASPVGDLIAEIERMGWVLDKIDHVYVETGAPTLGGSGGGIKLGQIRGQYLFRTA